jgi:hypothetical protein
MGKALTRPSGTSNATFELIRFPLSKNEAAMIFGSVDQKRPSAETKSPFFSWANGNFCRSDSQLGPFSHFFLDKERTI